MFSAGTPILLALGVDVDHYVVSKNLIVELSGLGFSVLYDEVIRCKHSTLVSSSPDTCVDYPSGFTQWLADNVDHNVITLDGRGTFHGNGHHIKHCVLFNFYFFFFKFNLIFFYFKYLKIKINI